MGDIDVSKQIKKLRQEFYKSEKGINNAKKLLNDVITLLNTKGKNKFADELKKNFADANKEIKETTKNIKKAEIDPKKLAINNLKQVGKEAKSKGDVGLYKRIKGFESTLNFNSSDEKLSDLNSRISYLEKQLRKTYGNSVADKFKEQVVKDPAENISPELEKQLALQEEKNKALKIEENIRKNISQNMKEIANISKVSGNKELSNLAKSFGQNISMSLGQKEAISNQEIMIQKVQETRKLVEELGYDYVKAFDETITSKISNEMVSDADELAQKFFKSISNVTELNDVLNVTDEKIDEANEEVKEQEVLWKKVKSVIGTVFSLGAIKIFFTKVSQGVQAIYKGMTKVIDVGGAVLETQNLFEVAMGENIEKAEKFQSAMHEAFGTNKEETKRYQAYFSQMATSLGIANDSAYTLSQGLTKLGMDISSLYNISQESAMQKLRAGLAGQTKSLRDVGLDITQQSLTPIAQELGITRSVKNLSQAEKILLRYVAVLRQANSAHGDMAKTIEQPANQLKVLQNQLKELAQAISNLFLPILKELLPYINGFVMALTEVINMLAIACGYTEELSSGLATNDSEIDLGLEDDLKQAKELNKSLGIDELNVLSQNEDESNGFGGIDPALLSAIQDYENGMENIRMKALDIRDAIMEWLGYVQVFDEEGNRIGWELGDGYTNLEKIRDILIVIGTLLIGINLYKLISSVMLLRTLFTSVWGIIQKIWGVLVKLVTWLGNMFIKFIGWISTHLKLAIGIVSIVAGVILYIQGIMELLKTGQLSWQGWLKVIGGIALVIAGIALAVGAVPALIAGIIMAVGLLIIAIVKNWDALVVTVKNAWEDVKAMFIIGVATIGKKLSTMGTHIEYFFKINLKQHINSIKALVLNVILAIAKKAQALINSVIEGFKNVAGLVDKIFGTDFQSNFKSVTFADELEKTINEIKSEDAEALKELKEEYTNKLDEITMEWATTVTNADEERNQKKQANLVELGNKLREKELEEQAKQAEESAKATNENTLAITDLKNILNTPNIMGVEDTSNNTEAIVNNTSALNGIQTTVDDLTKNINASNYENLNIDGIDALTENQNMTNDALLDNISVDENIESLLEENNAINGTQATKTEMLKMLETIVRAIKDVQKACENIKINVTKVISGGGASSGSSGGSLLSKITSTIRGYATGGMPESGEMFYANENGMPELVGKIGNRTAVMNNTQIVQAVSNGVANAVSRIFASQSERPINVSVQVDSREIARANNSGQKKLGHKIVGGAFAKG